MNQAAQIFEPKEVELYSEFTAQLQKMKDDNSKAVFDYGSPKGNKEARSHIFSLRKVKSALEQARKDAKAKALEYGRLVDSKAKEINSELEAMISLHETPLLEIENKEKERVAAINASLASLTAYMAFEPETIAEAWALELKRVEAFAIDDSLAEFKPMAAIEKDKAITAIKAKLEARIRFEAEQAELARLRQEEVERQQKEREAKIAQEAADRAKREAEEAAERQRQADIRAQQEKERKAADAAKEQQLALERAQREKAEAETRAANAEKAAREKADRDLKEQQDAERAAAAKREANKRHHAKVNNEAVSALVNAGLSEDMAKLAVVAIAKREVPHVTISY